MIGFPWRFAIIAMAVASTAHAHAAAWQPPAGGEQIALWRDPAVVARPEAKGEESASTAKSPVAGRTWTKIENVVRPTMTVFPAKDANTGAAIVVFPGGGYNILAIDLEGTEVCDWLTQKGVTCVVLKYRVPG